MRLMVFSVIVLIAVTVSGCTSSGQESASKRQGIIIANHSFLIASESFDDDFEMIEKELNNKKQHVSDPLKPVNHMMYHLNDRLYFWLLKPLGNAYKGVVPRPARCGIRNFFHNLTTPARFVNCMLQGKKRAAGKELYRFALNTTEGVLGLGDPAKTKYGLEPTEEDLGQTLAKHGVGNGIYLVLPLMGPSTLRDTFGMVGDQFLNPVRYVKTRRDSMAITAFRITNEKSFQIGDYESFKETSPEPYIGIREAYIQYRTKMIEQ